MSDLTGSILTVGFVLLFLGISEVLAKLGKISKENARKLIHISVGNVVFFVPLFETRWIAAIIPFSFVFGNYLLSPNSPVNALRLSTFKAGHAWGTVLYPLSLSIVVYFGFEEPWIIAAAFLPLVYGDGLAAVVGPRASTGYFSSVGGQKTLIGSAVLAFSSWLTVLLGVSYLSSSVELGILVASFVAIITPILEILSPKGFDNLVIPPSLLLFFSYFENDIYIWQNNISIFLFSVGIGLGILFALGGYFGKALTIDGAITGFLITTFMLGLGGYTLGSQLFLFFVAGSVATKIVKRKAGEQQDEFEKGGEQRDSLQALAKSGLPALFTLIYLTNPTISMVYMISGVMCASLVDTMSTEIGIASNSMPRSILKPWQIAKKGETGVISVIGTLGGIISGLIFATIVFLISKIDNYLLTPELQFRFIIVISIAGVIGMFSDSIIGKFVQKMNICTVCDSLIEAELHHGKSTEYHHGIIWFNNDMTNFVGTTLGGITALLIYYML